MPIPLKLTVYKGSELSLEQVFERDIIKIGRLASAHLKLDDAKVSRIHAVIESSGAGAEYSIIDMGSTEGTFLNGEKVSKEKLSDGDELRLGDCRILVSFDGAPERAGVPQSQPRGVPVPIAAPPGEQLWAASPSELQQAEPTITISPMPLDMMSSMQPSPSRQPPPPPPMVHGQVLMQQPVSHFQVQHGNNGTYGRQEPWGSVPNNLASDGVSDGERALEIKALWGGTTVLDSVSVTEQPMVTIGDERKVTGWGPLQKVLRCDLEVPSKGLPSSTFPLAEMSGSPGGGTSYTLNIPASFTGRLEKADGTMRSVEEMIARRGANIDSGEGGGIRYHLQNAETLYLVHNAIVYQCRYVRRARMIPPPLIERLNYTWLNILVLAFFLHTMAIITFIATPVTQAELTEDIFKNRNRFAQFRLTPEQQQKQQSLLLSKLKAGEPGAKAKGVEGKAGRKDYDPKKKQGRMAVKGDPNDKEIAKSTLAKLFGGKGNVGRSYLFGSGGLGGELKGALGGVTGAEIGDATGLGGLGTRGTGPGGGGLSMNSVGLGALGTHGRGGGEGGYGEGIGGLGKKADRDINISAGNPIIMGSLDKEIIRRIIKQHIAQIRYCYEKELVRNPGLFGKVATQFTISANGAVQSADVTQSTLGNTEAERCITAKIRTWQFPKPKGGGIVIVKYPFIFKTSG